MLQLLAVSLIINISYVCSESPSMQLRGEESQYLDCSETYMEMGATASTPCGATEAERDLTDRIRVTVWYKENVGDTWVQVPTVNGMEPGFYEVRYYVEDYSTPPLSAMKIRSVRVWDVVDFEINGDELVEWQCGVAYDDLGTRAMSVCLGDLTDDVELLGLEQLIAAEVGRTYTLTYRLENPQLPNVLELTRRVLIVDTVEPSIALVGLGADTDLQLRTKTHCDGGSLEMAFRHCQQPVWYDQNNPRTPICSCCGIGCPFPCEELPPTILPIPGEKFFVQEYANKYGSNPPVDMPATWRVLERGMEKVMNVDGDGEVYYSYSFFNDLTGLSFNEPYLPPYEFKPRDTVFVTEPEPLMWYCDTGYVDPGVEVWDDCEGQGDPSQVLIILTRYLIEATRAEWSRGGCAFSYIPYHREVFQYVGTIDELNEEPFYLIEPGDEGPLNYTDPNTGQTSEYYLKWGGYRAYYFIKDRQGNPALSVKRTIRSRFIIPEYEAKWTAVNDVVIGCHDPYFSLLRDVTLFDQCVGDLTASVTVTGDFDPNVPGSYTVLYNGQNIYGRNYSRSRVITVVDNAAPSISLLNESGQVVAPVPPARFVNDYIPWCAWRDGLWESDKPKPTEVGWDWWNDWFLIKPYRGYVAYDDCEEDVTQSVFMTGENALREDLEFMDEASSHLGEENPENWDIRPYANGGRYSLWISFMDGSQNTNGANRIINILPTYPEITFSTPSPLVVECGDEAVIPEPDIWDVTEDGEWRCGSNPDDIQVEIEGQAPIFSETGVYERTFTVTNAVWNTASAEYVVQVKDTLDPEVVVVPGFLEWDAGTPFDWQGRVQVTGTDRCDGDIPVLLTDRDGLNFTNPVRGFYRLVFSAQDSSGHVGEGILQVFVDMEAEPENDPPVISLLGQTPWITECGNPFIDPGATASDEEDGDLTVNIVTSGEPDTSTPGLYRITYSVVDEDQSSTSVVRVVRVEDSIPPIVTLRGNATMTIRLNDRFFDPGAMGSDMCSGAVMSSVEGVVNTSRPGVYTLSYTATDQAGNVSVPLTRKVTVVGSVNAEGEVSEGEVTEGEDDEGEDVEGEIECCDDNGCCGQTGDKSLSGLLDRLLGDYLLVGLCMIMLGAWRYVR